MVTNTLSMAEHTHGIISSCTQTLHALRILRSHGMPDVALFEVFRGVVIAKLSYAASAWWGCASADDKQRLNAFIRRSIRQGYCSSDINLADIIDTAHNNLFHQVLNDPNHVLAHLLPNRTSSQYNLRTRQHDRQLIPKMSKIFDNNFIVRKLYKDVYWLYCSRYYIWLSMYCFYTCMFMMRFVIVFLNEYEWMNECWETDWHQRAE